MPDAAQLRLVDTFSDVPFAGAPVAVVLDADGLNVDQRRSIARELQTAETAFVSAGNDLHRMTRIDIFGPDGPTAAFGNAFIAVAHAFAELSDIDSFPGSADAALAFDTAHGPLSATPEEILERTESLCWWVTLPPPRLEPVHANPMRLARTLGLDISDFDPGSPIMRTEDGDVLIVVQSWQRLVEAVPAERELAELAKKHGWNGVGFATAEAVTESVAATIRYFGCGATAREEVVTARVAGNFGVLFAVQSLIPTAGGRTAVQMIQGRPGIRSGIVRVRVASEPEGYSVALGGFCYTTLVGELRVPSSSRASGE